jgi:DNA-binding transcriptional LysR family regulator
VKANRPIPIAIANEITPMKTIVFADVPVERWASIATLDCDPLELKIELFSKKVLIMRIINLDDLHIFRCVAVEGGILKAAALLNRVPSNVTTRIKQFENRLGTQLFRRQGRNVVLTDTGRTLLGHAERLLRMADEVEQELCHGVIRGTLRLGALESAASVRLPPILSKYHAEHPETHIELQTGTTGALLRQLENHQIDAAFVSEPFEKGRLSSVEAFREELVLITSQATPTVKNAIELANQSVVAFPHGCSYRRLLVEWFAESGVSPYRFLDLGSYHAIVACVAAGAGVAIVPAGVLDNAVMGNSVRRHTLPKKLRKNCTHLVWSGSTSSRLQELIELLPNRA